MTQLLGWVRDTYRRILHVGQVREWLGRHGVTVVHLARGAWWWTPSFYSYGGYKYFKLQASFLKWTWQWERRT